MRGFLAVLRREVAERWLIAVAALLLGLVPLLAPLLPLGSHLQGPDIRGGTALALALILSYVLALVLGSTVLARDLAERRLAFYFSRPLPGWAIWAGKLGGAALLSLGAGLLVLLPSLLLGDRPDPGGLLDPGLSWGLGLNVAIWNLAIWAVSVLVLLLLANALGVMIRSRSPWLLLDLAAAAATVVLAWVIGARLLFAGAYGALVRGHLGFLTGLLLALLAASAVQVIRARTDLRRGHRLLSLTLWSLLGVSLAALGAYSQWVLSVSPQDLARVEGVQPAPAGDWVAVYGVARGRADFRPTFLLDTSSGRFFRIQAADGRWGDVIFSGDGRRAVWLAANGRRLFPLTAYRLDLDRPGAAPVATPVSFAESFPELLAVSRDGRYLASLHKDRIVVEDVEKGRLLLSEPVLVGESWGRQWLLFLENGLLRFYGRQLTGSLPGGTRTMHLMDIDLAAGRVVRSLRIPLDQNQMLMRVSQDGGHVLLESRELQPSFSELRIFHVLTEEMSPPIPLRGIRSSATFLRDGRILTSVRAKGRIDLRLLDSRGTELHRFDLVGSHLRIGGQPDPGHLVVGTAPARSDNQVKDWRCFLLDLERGTLRPIGDGLLPAGWLAQPTGGLGAELFIRE
ncbi:MAG TPA: hypothetical protein VL025_22170, partial [Thermoanaerobaculia bacterium]|nr:hypothetical protein [Thermoanaerobaculia bacterium]